mmetsp:Transcript_16032/g.22837  ORF Transcript_16032/g.22837 Transcript_16032/m.22837 type:complete len:112 (+) Transcript_16032:162-497(+)|eukprot:CAMPEP_0184856170 /NCGR_PEP_ID=MMETSP0580-20130426/1324_1 /TAXON_ID=1118495 /ORGANISM="Dactyliosolen fragilissimus" /LENGTH=111 /DNA_ID=CAMNT_0027351001 /DNA_START=152 /DNA_END=487 /DNA_ORIENTATION=+
MSEISDEALPGVMKDVEETINRIKSHKGVEGILVMTNQGEIIQSTLTDDQATSYGSILTNLIRNASNLVKAVDPGEDLTFVTVRSKNKDIMVANDKDFMLVVIQDPSSNSV